MDENEIAKVVVDAALKVHQALGPGLLESVYEIVLAHELIKRGLRVKRQAPIAIEYDGITFELTFVTLLCSPVPFFGPFFSRASTPALF